MPAEAMKADTARGVGLVGVRERAGRLGGTVKLDSQPGHGTRLTIEIPIAAAETETAAAAAAELPAMAQERVH
jgi:signal transduction histidine kinase